MAFWLLKMKRISQKIVKFVINKKRERKVTIKIQLVQLKRCGVRKHAIEQEHSSISNLQVLISLENALHR